MLLEKKDGKAAAKRSAYSEEFRAACESLWENHVRAELILGKRLRFCYTCCAFYYQADPEANHPETETESVQRLFVKVGVTCQASLANFLWETLETANCRPAITWSMMSSRHQPRAIGFPQGAGMAPLNALQGQVEALSAQLVQSNRAIQELEAEKRTLKEENQHVISELLKLRLAISLDYGKISCLAGQIENLCHFPDCCHKNEGQEQHSSN
jgi:hypothetical protein